MTHAFTMRDEGPPRNPPVPFAALPHDIAADPRLSPTDVRVLLALLFWARSAGSCWASDRSRGLRIGRSPGTAQRSLRRLEALGYIERQQACNPTGRLIVLAPEVTRRRSTPTSPALDALQAPALDECIERSEVEVDRPASSLPPIGPPPPAGEPEEPTVAELHQWRDGDSPVLRKIAERRLAELAAEAEVVVVEPAVEPQHPHPGPAFAEFCKSCPDPSPVETSAAEPAPPAEAHVSPIGEKPASTRARPTIPPTATKAPASRPWSQGLPRSTGTPARQRPLLPAVQQRHDRGPRHFPGRLIDSAPAVLPVGAVGVRAPGGSAAAPDRSP